VKTDFPSNQLLTIDHSSEILQRIQQGAVFAYPTEGVWGIGASVQCLDAVADILTLKQRPQHKGLIVVCSDLEQLSDWLEPLDDDKKQQVLATWPGPVTWVLPCKESVPEVIRGEHTSIAVRVSAHPLVQKLCKLAGPLISTSANPAGEPSAMSAEQVQQYFPQQLGFIVEGELGGQQGPSEIRTLDGIVLR